MNRRFAPALLASCVVLFGCLVGCDEKGTGKKVDPPFQPDACDVLLMLSGSEGGLLKPCGCSTPQRGGLERRAALFDRARAKAKVAGAISVGEALGPGLPDQNGYKADLLRETFAVTGYSGQLLSGNDLSPFLTALSQPRDAPETTPRPPLNVKVRATGPLAASATADPILRLKLGDLPVRAVSVVDATLQALLVEHWGVADMVIAPEAALRALPKEPGLLVVAAHVMREDLALVSAAAAAAADLAVVVDVPGEVASDLPVRDRSFERPLLVKFDRLGKEVGLLRLVKGEKGWRAAYDAVRLDPPFEEGESASRDAVSALFADYRRRVRESGLLASYPTFKDDGPTFVGAAACQPCHPAIHASWEQTPHAHALDTLVAKDYAWDPECVRCHTVGWRKDVNDWSRTASSFKTPDASPALAGVQCEHCHGAGSAHVKEPERKDLFGRYGDAGRMWRSPGEAGCRVCHDPDNSTEFNKSSYEKRYLPKVDHRDVPPELRVATKPK